MYKESLQFYKTVNKYENKTLKPGKLPLDHLEDLLKEIPNNDPRVELGPSIGEDAALIDIGDKYLVAKTDPITFATEKIGWYAVHVNANDIAAMGATPKWMLATILLPDTASDDDAKLILGQITDACDQMKISLIGGHTEVTYGLSRPIVSGTMLGEVEKGKEVRSSGSRIGDSIIMTKSIPIEGCAILATEAKQILLDSGISSSEIKTAQELLNNPGISVVNDAIIAAKYGNVTAMHDPTEGGIYGGLAELAKASGLGMHVFEENIIVTPLGKKICNVLGINPMGMIASGSLLICSDPVDEDSIITALSRHGITAIKIGEMKPKSYGTKVRTGNRIIDMPSFERDELARFLSD